MEAQQLRALVVHLEDPSLIPSTQLVTHSSLKLQSPGDTQTSIQAKHNKKTIQEQ